MKKAKVNNLEVLKKTRELFATPNSWIKDSLVDYAYDSFYNINYSKPSYCLVGGFAKALTWTDAEIEDALEDDVINEIKLAAQTVTDVIVKHYPERLYRAARPDGKLIPANVIPYFNDHHNTTIEDIRRVLRLAEARLKRQAAGASAKKDNTCKNKLMT